MSMKKEEEKEEVERRKYATLVIKIRWPSFFFEKLNAKTNSR